MTNPKSTAQIAGHPIHPMLIPFPIACFVLTLISDLAFWKTSNDFWASASLWLLGIGLIMAALAAVMWLILSLVVVLILLFTGWKGWEMVYRHRVGVTDQLS